MSLNRVKLARSKSRGMRERDELPAVSYAVKRALCGGDGATKTIQQDVTASRVFHHAKTCSTIARLHWLYLLKRRCPLPGNDPPLSDWKHVDGIMHAGNRHV